jgi:nucleotidyltransferase-like protein
MHQQPWAVILAGGNGSRLRSLTRRVAGDERPKQFCSLCGEHTLLTQTRLRLSHAVAKERTLFSVVRVHERFYTHELADVRPSRLVVQSANKGTTLAIISSLYRLLELTGLDEDPIVGFFPTDHYYADEERFVAAVDSAFEACGRNTRTPMAATARSNSREKMLSRSWMRTLNEWSSGNASRNCCGPCPLQLIELPDFIFGAILIFTVQLNALVTCVGDHADHDARFQSVS